MTILTGIGYGARAVMGRAARVSFDGGRATLDESVLTSIARHAEREDVTLDLVLIAEDASLALLLGLPAGAQLVAVIAEKIPAAPPHLPHDVVVIAGVESARIAIGDGVQVIVDAPAGRVLVEPYAEDVVKLQAAPRRPRILLGAVHTPAVTLTGRRVAVWARVTKPEQIASVIDEGADGLFIEPDVENGDGSWDEAALLSAIAAMGGGDVALHAPIEWIDSETVLHLAASASLRWCLDPSSLPVAVDDLRAELSTLVDEMNDRGEPASMPRLMAATPTGAMIDGFDEAFAIGAPELDPNILPWDRPPLYARVAEVFGEYPDLEDAFDAGASGFIVDPGHIEAIKERIRQSES